MFILAKRNIIIPSPETGMKPVVLKKTALPPCRTGLRKPPISRLCALTARSLPPSTATRRRRPQPKSRSRPAGQRPRRSLLKPMQKPLRQSKEHDMMENQPFCGVRQQAADLGQNTGDYTAGQFKEEYPQFCNADGKCHLPDALLNEIVRMANVSVQPDKWLDSWHYAVGLYVAHYVTLQLRTFAESSATPAQAAASGALVGVVKSATLGDSSVTYDTSA